MVDIYLCSDCTTLLTRTRTYTYFYVVEKPITSVTPGGHTPEQYRPDNNIIPHVRRRQLEFTPASKNAARHPPRVPIGRRTFGRWFSSLLFQHVRIRTRIVQRRGVFPPTPVNAVTDRCTAACDIRPGDISTRNHVSVYL